MRLASSWLLAVLLAAGAVAEDFQVLPDPPEDGKPDRKQQWPPDKPTAWPQHKPKARAGVMVARYVPQSKMPRGVVVPFANITYRIVGQDLTMANINSRYAEFELAFKKLYGGANLHSKILYVRSSEPAAGTVERPCRAEFDDCCNSKGAVADPATWAAIDVTLEVGASRDSLWPDQGSLDWAHARILGTLFAQHGFDEVRCLLQRADVLPAGVHAHKHLPITALYTEETVLQFTGNSLSRWLPVDIATQNLILHSMDLMGLNRIAGCARIRITNITQKCLWEPGRGQIGVANVTFVSHREYPETTLPMAFAKSLHVLLERLNEEGLNIANIDVVGNRPVKGPEWGNMHDQIESMLEPDDQVRTYETRIPDEQLPNFKSPTKPLPWSTIAAAVTLAAVLGGSAVLLRRRQAALAAPKPRTVPLSAFSKFKEPEIEPAFPRRESSNPQALREMWSRTSGLSQHLSVNPSVGPPQRRPLQALMDGQDPDNSRDPASFAAFMERMWAEKAERAAQGLDVGDELRSVGSAQSTWQANKDSMDSPNPFLTDANIHLPVMGSGSGSGGSGISRNFGTMPAAMLIQQGSSQGNVLTEQQRQEQRLRSQKAMERGALFEQQLARADSVASWLLSAGEIEICLAENGSKWLLGAGSYGKVYRGVRGGVQDVAIKVLQTSDEIQVTQFCLEIKLLKSLSFDRNIVQFLGVCLHSGDPMLVLEFMEGGDLRKALSGPDHARYAWNDLGQLVALDVVRGLHFLHTNKVVHSDLKSRNVLLGRDGQTAKLSDVGMSRILSGSRSLPTPGDVAGTFPYAAPELLLAQPCTVKADIFSLGVLFWEICTHDTPVRGQLRPLEVPRECSRQVAALIEECCHFDPGARPSAREVFDRIREDNAKIANMPSLASSGELSHRLGEPSGSRRQLRVN